MKYGRNDSINFYRGYQQKLASQKSKVNNKRLGLILPLALLVAVLIGVSGYLLAQNRQKQRELEALQAHIAGIQGDYEQAIALQSQLNTANATYQALAAGKFTFAVYPTLDATLFNQVRECAKGIFNISAYSYDEATCTLSVDASADSVNEVPKFVERLRATKLFDGVQYTGYTSDDTQEYFCTVGCTLPFAYGSGDTEPETTVNVETKLNGGDVSDAVQP